MKKIIALLGVVLLASCSSKPAIKSEASPIPSTTSQVSVASINVRLDAVASNPRPTQALVEGTTNLPDGFVLIISACRYYLEKKDGKNHCLGVNKINPVDQEVTVKGGEFKARFIVPTKEELNEELNKFAEISQDPELTQSSIKDAVDISIIGTPVKQSSDILALIGGDKAPGLQGKHSEMSLGFRTVQLDTEIKM